MKIMLFMIFAEFIKIEFKIILNIIIYIMSIDILNFKNEIIKTFNSKKKCLINLIEINIYIRNNIRK